MSSAAALRQRTSSAEDAGCTVGIDLGGTKILGVVLDAVTGEIVDKKKIPNPRSDGAAAVAAFQGMVESLTQNKPPLLGVGVGLAGLVDLDGVLRYGPNVPGILDFSVRAPLETSFGVPVVVGNDAAMAARAELDRGAARGAKNVVLVTQGTGIGGALVVDGAVVSGSNGFAGEPGHMLIQRNGHRCACGQFGCWEAYASGAGLVNLWSDLRAEGRGLQILERAGGIASDVRGEHIAEAASEGDQDATEIFERFAGWVAQGLGSLVTLLDPDLIVLGGGLARANDLFLPGVQEQMREFVLGPDHRPAVPVVGAALGETSGAVGAAIVALPGHFRP